MELSGPDAAIVAACKQPVLILTPQLTQAQTEKYWSMDRAELIDCGKRHAELTRYQADLFKRLRKK